MTPEDLIKALYDAFGYTTDNNRDLLADETFPINEVMEELQVESSFKFLAAYIARNRDMIATNLLQD